LLGLIIEKIAKRHFFEVLREEVFNPLGMKDTGLIGYDPIANQERLAPVIVKKKIFDYTSHLVLIFLEAVY
jgi:CubicO group peptidase (beta-lactamase class C family)